MDIPNANAKKVNVPNTPNKGLFGRIGNRFTKFQNNRKTANAEKAQAYRTRQANLKAHINSKNHLKKFAKNQNIESLVEASNLQNIDKIINSAYKSVGSRSTFLNKSKVNSKERINAINDLLRKIGNGNAPILNPKTQRLFSRIGSSFSSGASAAIKTLGKVSTIGTTKVGLTPRQQKLLNGYKKIFGNKNFSNLEYNTKTNNAPINKFLNNLGIEKTEKFNRTGQMITKYNRFLRELERQHLLGRTINNPNKNNKRSINNLRKEKAVAPANGKPVNGPVMGRPVNNKTNWNTVKKELANVRNIDHGIEAIKAIVQAKQQYKW
jgi:hypothetical protein